MIARIKTKLTDQEWATNVTRYSQNIWLAGLGAYARVQDQGARTFESLVKTGTQVETRAIKVAGERIEQVVSDTTKSWNDLQRAVEAGAKKSLSKLKLASSAEIDALVARIDKVKEQLAAMAKGR